MITIDMFIGIPFVDRGRLLSGADCYGVVMMYYKEILGIDIPDVNVTVNEPKKSFVTYLTEVNKHWIRLDKPEQHCGVALRLNTEHPKLVTHFGVMIDNNRLLHSLRPMGSHIIRIDNPVITSYIEGFYRWQP